MPELILFYGAGPGTGKSTLAYFAYRQLVLNGHAARCVMEADVLWSPAFAPYVRAVEDKRGYDSGILLKACEAFVAELAQADGMHIVDSILPCTDWLVAAGCPRGEVIRFSRALNDRLRAFEPLLVLLTGDIEVALARATARRGDAWARMMADERGGMGALMASLRQRRALALELAAQWPYAQWRIDTTAGEWTAYEEEILAGLNLERRDFQVAADILASYVGVYRHAEGGREIRVEWRGDHLWAGASFPAGCRLLPESATRFHLEAGSDYIEFGAGELAYWTKGRWRRYGRL